MKFSALDRLPFQEAEMDDHTSVETQFGMAMVEDGFTRQELNRLRRPGPYGLVVRVPRPEHVALVQQALECLTSEAVEVVEVHSTYSTIGGEALVGPLIRGNVAVAVCSDTNDVPPAFLALADGIKEMKPHDARLVHKVLRRVIGGKVPKLPPGTAVHPDPALVCSCIVPGLSAARIVSAIAQLAGMSKSEEPDVDLPDLADCVEFGEARDWGLAVVEDIRAWETGGLNAADLDTAALLVSPPGHGKTFFARVLAKALGAPVFEVTVGGVFQGDGNLGDVLKSMRERFRAATAQAPAVLLIDELDGFGRRDAKDHNAAFMTAMINELLSLLDGASGRRPGLVILGATNRAGAVDPALLRPGRLSRTIEMPLPDDAGREHVLRVHLRSDLVEDSIERAVRLSAGFTSATLMNAVRAGRRSARAAGRNLTVVDVEKAMTGDARDDDALFMRVAVHEAGHALAALFVPDAPILKGVTLTSSGATFGHVSTVVRPGANTRQRVEAGVILLLAGRAAEEVVYGDDPSDGAGGDLQTATMTLCEMHANFGMAGTLLHRVQPERLLSSDRTFASLIESDLQRLYTVARQMLVDRREMLDRLATALLARRSLSAVEVGHILGARHPVGQDGTEPYRDTVRYRIGCGKEKVR